MAELIRREWDEFVDEAVDELFTVVSRETPLAEELLDERPRRGSARVFGLEDDLRRPHETSDARHLLVSYSMRLLSAAAAASTVRCSADGTTVDCELRLSPDRDAHYRCVGHSPPHCYRLDGRPLTRCP